MNQTKTIMNAKKICEGVTKEYWNVYYEGGGYDSFYKADFDFQGVEE